MLRLIEQILVTVLVVCFAIAPVNSPAQREFIWRVSGASSPVIEPVRSSGDAGEQAAVTVRVNTQSGLSVKAPREPARQFFGTAPGQEKTVRPRRTLGRQLVRNQGRDAAQQRPHCHHGYAAHVYRRAPHLAR